jgi:hypothetical protein
LESTVVSPVIFLKGYIINFILEVGIGQHIVDECERVSEPDLVLGHHPIRNIMIWQVPSYLTVKDSRRALPRRVASIFSYISRVCDEVKKARNSIGSDRKEKGGAKPSDACPSADACHCDMKKVTRRAGVQISKFCR